MPRFTRTRPAPPMRGTYQSFRPTIRHDFEEHCAYCLVGELMAGGQENFELDHFRPRSKFPGLEGDFYNLYYACHICNHFKSDIWPTQTLQESGIGFVDLCQDDFEQHFREEPDGTWVGLTVSARYTIDIVQLNRPHLLALRQFLRQIAVFLARPE